MNAKAPQPPPGNPDKYSGKGVVPSGMKPRPSPPPPPPGMMQKCPECEGRWGSAIMRDCPICGYRVAEHLLREEVERLQVDRDAWRAATGLVTLTPAEAGAQIDAEDEERERLQGEVSAARTEAFAHGYKPECEDDEEQAIHERVDCLMKWIAESEAEARRERDEAFGKVKRLQAIFDQVRKVADTGTLPDGDGVNVPTGMWLEQLAVEAAEEVRG